MATRKYHFGIAAHGLTLGGMNLGNYWQAASHPPHSQAVEDARKAFAKAHARGSISFDTGKGAAEDVTKLEEVAGDLPILAKRLARLRFAGDSMHWASLNHTGVFSGSMIPFGVDAEARCSAWATSFSYETNEHTSPKVDCTCGFYATPLDGTPVAASPAYVTLLVELSGKVIEHELMFRAEHQRVIECQIPRCMYCNREPNVMQVRDGEMAQVACSRRHLNLRNKRMILSVEDVRELLPVPVTILEP